MVTVGESEFLDHDNSGDGYCPDCDAIIECGGLEPDAEGGECEICGKSRVMGVAQALLMGHIDIGQE